MMTIFIIALVLIVIGYVSYLYNRLVRHRNLVKEGWSSIDVFGTKYWSAWLKDIRLMNKVF